MMNEETKHFEQRLSHQPLRKIPSDWRNEILATALATPVTSPILATTRRSIFSIFNHQLSAFFWPHPKAWAGLAAIWIFIFTVNFSARDTSPKLAIKVLPPTPEVLVELKQQQRLFAELMGNHETVDADRPRIFSPKPRSEWTKISVG